MPNQQQQFGQNQQNFQQPQFQNQQNQQYQQQQMPNQQFGQNQQNQQFQQQQNFSDNNNNNNNGQAAFMPAPKKSKSNKPQSSGLLNQDKNAPPASAAFGILAKSNSTGVRVTTIGIASRAAKSGLQRSDVIRAVDGVVIQSENQFQQIMSGKRPGQSIQLLIDRKGAIGQIVL
jgi:predicted metalloprotease with PDZ domain